MAKPLTIDVAHRLGREEARRRMSDGLQWFRQHHGAMFGMSGESWGPNGATFQAGALGYSAPVDIFISDTRVTVSVTLPWLAWKLLEPHRGPMAARIIDLLQSP